MWVKYIDRYLFLYRIFNLLIPLRREGFQVEILSKPRNKVASISLYVYNFEPFVNGLKSYFFIYFPSDSIEKITSILNKSQISWAFLESYEPPILIKYDVLEEEI